MSDSALETLWKHVLDHWDNEASHRAFLEHCSAKDALAEAAVRYRGMKGDHQRGPIAEKKLVAIAALAVARLEATRTPARSRRGGAFGYALVALFLLGSIGLLAYLGASR